MTPPAPAVPPAPNPVTADTLAVGYEPPVPRERAQALADRLGVGVAKRFGDPRPLRLTVTPDRLEFRVTDPGHPLAGGRGLVAEPHALDTRSASGRSKKSPLHKAVGLGRRPPGNPAAPPPHVFDATAGLGEDAWLLAAAGCRVTAAERHPVVHALLADGLDRARTAAPDVADRITLLSRTDAAEFLAPSGDPPPGFDVVLLDPMFPGHAKRKTTERKPLRLLRLLAGDDPDADALFPFAAAAATRRVVVKRPRHAPFLAGQTPAVSHAGRGLRFDVYPTRYRAD
ncbi:MAG: class I SAM-dependent methyltransferase [Planctomycetota bacterium]